MDQGERGFGSDTRTIIGACIEVHRALGPGLLEAAYEACLAHELRRQGCRLVQQPLLPLEYKGLRVERAYQPDLIVDDRIIVEIKAVQSLRAIHCAQLRTYLRLYGLRVGLLINFNVTALRNHGIRRIQLSSPPSPPRLPS